MAAVRHIKYGISCIGLAVGILGISLILYEGYGWSDDDRRRSDVKRLVLNDRNTWAEWSAETSCTFTSQGCAAFKFRKCLNGTDCNGLTFETVSCSAKNCPAIWTEWATTKDDSGRCVHKRQRDCTGVSHPPNCTTVETKIESCNTSEWSAWSDWKCRVNNNNLCLYMRERECYIGLDQIQCTGSPYESMDCTEDNCKSHLNPHWGEWSDRQCGGEGLTCFTYRNRTCSTGSNTDCGNEYSDIAPCNDQECKVNWMDWSHWECVSTHGILAGHRVRNCSSGDTNDCDGKPYELLMCSTAQCSQCPNTTISATTMSSTTAHWLEWSHLECIGVHSTFSATRFRNCSTGTVDDCSGRSYSIKPCGINECPECNDKRTTVPTQPKATVYTVAGLWLEWGQWSCTQANGVNVATRHRSCSTGDSNDCDESKRTYDVHVCGVDACQECFESSSSSPTSSLPTIPSTTERMSYWSEWTHFECANSHGLLFLVRYRNCSFDVGTECVGENNELHLCTRHICGDCYDDSSALGLQSATPMPSTVSSLKSTTVSVPTWSSWTHSECSVSHGLTFLIRYRNCTDKTGCKGDNHDLHYCNNKQCPQCHTQQTNELDTCMDKDAVQCNVPAFRNIVCQDESLARSYCKKSCNLCRQSRETIHASDVRRQEVSHWGEWSKETSCTFTSTGCAAFRFRKCSTQPADCTGTTFEQVTCTSSNCPAIWTEWITSGDGLGKCVQKRQRDCTGVISSHPPNCTTFETKTESCNASEWSDWSGWECRVNENNQCHYRRERECYLGLDLKQCAGSSNESVDCTEDNCKGFLHSYWGEWSDRQCGGEGLTCFTYRNRTCSTGSNADCGAEYSDIEPCNDQDCKVHWLEWSHWECLDTHGIIAGHRVRNCSTVNAPDCEGKPYELITCNTTHCPECENITSVSSQAPTISTHSTVITNQWLEWSHWECINTHGLLAANRFRNCSTANTNDCDGRGYFIKPCVDFKCPECRDGPTTAPLQPQTTVNAAAAGSWLEWGEWSCTQANGLNVATRHRNCSTGDNNDCDESKKTYDIHVCGMEACQECSDIGPVWLQWSEWVCTAVNSIPFKIRSRNCSISEKLGCPGDSSDINICTESTCQQCSSSTSSTSSPVSSSMATTSAITDHWSNWTHWECSKSHGVHFIVRYRNCLSDDTNDCAGENHELHSCTQPTCPYCYDDISTVVSSTITSTPSSVPLQNQTAGPAPTWSSWTHWECSASHGLNFLIRYRNCSNNTGCLGDNHELNYCVQQECPQCYPQPEFEETCLDKDAVQCNVPAFFEIVCADADLARVYCRKSCQLCVPQDRCKDSYGCDAELSTIKCNVSTTTCPIRCGLCFPLDKCQDDGPGCDEELKSITCNDPLLKSACPILCGLCVKTTPGPITEKTSNPIDTATITVTTNQTKVTTAILTTEIPTSPATVTNTTQSPAITSTPTNLTSSTETSSTPTLESPIPTTFTTQKLTTTTTQTDTTKMSSTQESTTLLTTQTPTPTAQTIPTPYTTAQTIPTTSTTAQTIPTESTTAQTIPTPSTTAQTIPTPSPTEKPTSTTTKTITVTLTTQKATMPIVRSTTAVTTTTTPETTIQTTTHATTTQPPPVTTAPTTIPPTSPITTTVVGSVGHTIAPIPTQCAVCVGPPDLCDQLFEVQPCNAPDNYCINHVKNYEDGHRDITRGCGNHATCYREWFQGSSDNDKCQMFEEDNIVTLAFECTYCCIKDACNVKLYPELDTLYKDV